MTNAVAIPLVYGKQVFFAGQNFFFPRLWTIRRVARLKLLRLLTDVDPLDEVEMLTKIASIAKKVTAFKSGCCGEFSMYAYNAARTINGCDPRLMMMKGERTDKHAFVLLGVATKISADAETSIADVAATYPDAVVVDYSASENGFTNCKGAFPIAVYVQETEDALSHYDNTRVTRVQFT